MTLRRKKYLPLHPTLFPQVECLPLEWALLPILSPLVVGLVLLGFGFDFGLAAFLFPVLVLVVVYMQGFTESTSSSSEVDYVLQVRSFFSVGMFVSILWSSPFFKKIQAVNPNFIRFISTPSRPSDGYSLGKTM